MSKLILITGDLASGKSTLADSLSAYFVIPSFKKDTIKEHYCDMYGFSNREENRKMSVLATDYMIHTFEQFAKQNNDLILEANFREEELDRIRQIADDNEVDVKLIVLRGDLEILYKRFLERLPNRHKAHMSLHLDESLEKFSSYVLEQRQAKLPFIPHIIDSTKKDEKEVLRLAIQASQ